jgi:hypothetical protein
MTETADKRKEQRTDIHIYGYTGALHIYFKNIKLNKTSHFDSIEFTDEFGQFHIVCRLPYILTETSEEQTDKVIESFGLNKAGQTEPAKNKESVN